MVSFVILIRISAVYNVKIDNENGNPLDLGYYFVILIRISGVRFAYRYRRFGCLINEARFYFFSVDQ